MSQTSSPALSLNTEIADQFQIIATDLSSLLNRLEVIRQNDDHQKDWIESLLPRLEGAKEVSVEIQISLEHGWSKLLAEDIHYFQTSLQKFVRYMNALSLEIGNISPRPKVSCFNFVGRHRISKIEDRIRNIGLNFAVEAKQLELYLSVQQLLTSIRTNMSSMVPNAPPRSVVRGIHLTYQEQAARLDHSGVEASQLD